MSCELANRESRAPHLRDLRDRGTPLSAAGWPEPNARRPQPGSDRRRRDPETRRDPVGADPGAVGRFQVGVGHPIADRWPRQPGSLGRRKAGSREQVRAALRGAADRFGTSPPRDRGVIARKQHRRDTTALVLDRPRVVRTFEETFGVRLVRKRGRLDHVGDEAGHRIDHDHGRKLSAGQHEVADRELLVDLAFDHALVDALVVPAPDYQVRQLRKTPSRGLVEQRALRAHEDDVTGVSRCRADRAGERLGLQHHAGAAAVGSVVDDVMAVGRPLADVVDREVDLTRGPGARDDALGEGTLEHLRKERQHVDARGHPRISCGTTTIRPPATSTSRTTDAIAGKRSSSREPAARTTSTSVSPARIVSLTVPSERPSGVSARRPRRSAQRYPPWAARRASARDTRRRRPRIRSASERLVWPSNRTIGTSAAPRTEAMTSSPMPSHRRRDPFWNRPATSLRGWTLTSPRTPCGAPPTPTIRSSLLIDFEVDLCSIARRHHFEECADGFRDPSAAADHLSDVRFGDLQVKLGEVAVLLLGHHDRRGVVDERSRDMLEEDAHPTRLRPGAGHFALAPVI